MSIEKLFEVQNGLQIGEAVSVLSGAVAPNISSGVVAPIGTVYLQTDGTRWVKFGSGDLEWRAESLPVILSYPRFPLLSVYNGTVSGGDWITYSNLTPDAPLVIPKKSTLRELTWSNSSTGISFDFTLRRNGRTETIFRTLQVRNSANKYGYFSETDINGPTFNPGDTLDVQYIDQGSNAADLCTVMFFQSEI